MAARFEWVVDGAARRVEASLDGGVLRGAIDGVPFEVEARGGRSGEVFLRRGDRVVRAVVARDGSRTLVHIEGRVFVLAAPEARGRSGGAGRGRDDAGAAVAPMTGVLARVEVQAGDAVVKGAALCVVEAMKMQFVVRAPRDLVVASVAAAAGARVDIGQVLVAFAPGAAAP
jgi:biotin carboxyl carrier protein